MPKALVNGVHLSYEVSGQGHPVLLIPGLSYAKWLWSPQALALSQHYTVITLDNRGSGESDSPDAPFSIRDMASDAKGLLDYLGIDCAHVVGASMGGFIAQTLAVDHPEAVTKLVLACTTMGGPEAVPMSTEVFLILAKPNVDIRERYREALSITMGREAYEGRPDLVEMVIERQVIETENEVGRRRQTEAALGFWGPTSVYQRLSEIKCPTLVMAGTEDKVVPIENSKRLSKLIPDSELALIDGGGHLFNLEKPREFNSVVMEFLGRKV